jgi:hypothetical protein
MAGKAEILNQAGEKVREALDKANPADRLSLLEQALALYRRSFEAPETPEPDAPPAEPK